MGDLGQLQAALDGDLLTPASSGYHAARRPALARYVDIRPRAVVRCASARDVTSSVAYAQEAGMCAVPRSGGHCFAGRSSTEGLLLDLARLDGVHVDAAGRATIGAGVRLAQVYDALHPHDRTIPAGCGATVGIAGLTLGGGIGLLGRMHGLTCDALISAQVVLSDGRLVECDTEREPDLFWALRGAGGGQFGVVTSFVFATIVEPHATPFELSWPGSAAGSVVAAWQQWAPDAPPEITANLTIVAEAGRATRVVVFGAALRGGDATLAMVAATAVRPGMDVGAGMAFRDLKHSAPSLSPSGGATGVTRSRSEFFARSLPEATITALLEEQMVGLCGRRELNLTAMGGAYNEVAPGATAFVHRDERFLLEQVADGEDVWVDRSWAIAHRHGSGGVYPNFPDPALTAGTEAYLGTNRSRLAEVKRCYDPDRFFDFPQAI